MSAIGWIALGAFAGFFVGLRLGPASESSCCKRVAAGTRDRVTGAVGEWAGPVGDALGVWDRAPTLLDAIGVPP